MRKVRVHHPRHLRLSFSIYGVAKQAKHRVDRQENVHKAVRLSTAFTITITITAAVNVTATAAVTAAISVTASGIANRSKTEAKISGHQQNAADTSA